jgi:glycine cleavage system H protein
MASTPADLRYTKDHEYVKTTSDPSILQVGITDYAQGELGDVVYVDLPKVGATFAQGATFGTIEAVKAVSELYSPVGGVVVEINATLDKEPAAVNHDPYGAGWMIKIKVQNQAELGQLLTADQYKQLIKQ